MKACDDCKLAASPDFLEFETKYLDALLVCAKNCYPSILPMLERWRKSLRSES